MPMMLDCFGIDKLHGFMMHSVMLAVGSMSIRNYNTRVQDQIDYIR